MAASKEVSTNFTCHMINAIISVCVDCNTCSMQASKTRFLVNNYIAVNKRKVNRQIITIYLSMNNFFNFVGIYRLPVSDVYNYVYNKFQ